MATVTATTDIYTAALGLCEADRLDLASRLLASVEPPVEDDWDDAWLTELDRREQAARSGGAVGAPWSEVHARVRAQLAAL